MKSFECRLNLPGRFPLSPFQVTCPLQASKAKSESQHPTKERKEARNENN